MTSTHTFRCEVCGHEHPDTYNYDDVTCEKCGREHVYDEGIHLKLSPEDALRILQSPLPPRPPRKGPMKAKDVWRQGISDDSDGDMRQNFRDEPPSYWHTWIGKGDLRQFLDPANWKDGRVPPMRGASVFVPSGSRIEAMVLPHDMILKRLCVEPDPKGTPPEKCTRIGTISAEQIELIAERPATLKGKP